MNKLYVHPWFSRGSENMLSLIKRKPKSSFNLEKSSYSPQDKSINREELTELAKLRNKGKVKNSVASLGVKRENCYALITQVEEKLADLKENNLEISNKNFQLNTELQNNNNYINKLVQIIKFMLENLAFDSSLGKNMMLDESNEQLETKPVSVNSFKFEDRTVKLLVERLKNMSYDSLDTEKEESIWQLLPAVPKMLRDREEMSDEISEIFSVNKDIDLNSIKGLPNAQIGDESPLWIKLESEFRVDAGKELLSENASVSSFMFNN